MTLACMRLYGPEFSDLGTLAILLDGLDDAISQRPFQIDPTFSRISVGQGM